ncbi:MAG: hypothetical protein DRO11_03590, partial [Methanobacteriota archaeon]
QLEKKLEKTISLLKEVEKGYQEEKLRREKIAGCHDRLLEIRTKLEEKIGEYQNKIRELQEKLSAKDDVFSARYQEKISLLEKDNKILREELSRKESRVKSLEEKLANAEKTIGRLNMIIEQRDRELNTQKQEIERLSKNVRELLEKLEKAEKRLEEQKNIVKTLEKKYMDEANLRRGLEELLHEKMMVSVVAGETIDIGSELKKIKADYIDLLKKYRSGQITEEEYKKERIGLEKRLEKIEEAARRRSPQL